jgi:RNA polymerase sigma-70 factor (ECF subfamily)
VVSHDDAAPDRLLAERARAGDARALDSLLSRHQEVAFRVAVAILRDDDRAADVVQDAFVKAFRGVASFRGEARFRTWLLTIVANEARRSLRRGARRREAPLDEASLAADGAPTPEGQATLRQEAARARTALAGLPDKQRLAVQLRVDEGLSFREVGEIIGSSEGAARVNYHHGIRRLRDMMEGDR